MVFYEEKNMKEKEIISPMFFHLDLIDPDMSLCSALENILSTNFSSESLPLFSTECLLA